MSAKGMRQSYRLTLLWRDSDGRCHVAKGNTIPDRTKVSLTLRADGVGPGCQIRNNEASFSIGYYDGPQSARSAPPIIEVRPAFTRDLQEFVRHENPVGGSLIETSLSFG